MTRNFAAVAVIVASVACEVQRGAKPEAPAVQATACQPAAVALKERIPVRFLSHWPRGTVIAVVCEGNSGDITQRQVDQFTDWLVGQVETAPESTRFCRLDKNRKAPQAIALREAQALLPTVSDWCWVFEPEGGL